MSITEDVPIKDVLIELARLSDLELALDPNIDGGIILKVKDRQVKEVIEMVADQASLRYSVDNGILKVQKDGPYIVTYNVDYINLNRSSKSSISTQTQVLSVDSSGDNSSGGGSGGGGSSNEDKGLNSGSTNEISSSYDGDIWKSVEDNINKIIYASNQELLKDTTKETNINTNPSYYYTINKQAGIISIMADSKKHKSIKKYLDTIKTSLSAQVLIEAKIVEVTLNEEYGAGIDWTNFTTNGFTGNLKLAPKGISDFLIIGSAANSEINNVARTKNLTQLATLLEGYGTTRTLSNPRISALNNQQAVLTFAKNQPYFTVSGTLQQNTTNTTTGNVTTTPVTITSTLKTIPIGIILSLQPSINLETQEITMNVRPTLSRRDTTADVLDPAVAILNKSAGGAGAESKIPAVEVREMDTVLKIKSGDVMVIGGLIEHYDDNNDYGVPGLSRIPILGNLAKQVKKKSTIKETVVFITATIAPTTGTYHPQDKKIYETFIQDTRPLTF
jgi:general secretion pathway protein D